MFHVLRDSGQHIKKCWRLTKNLPKNALMAGKVGFEPNKRHYITDTQTVKVFVQAYF